jgi:hypothetical protein
LKNKDLIIKQRSELAEGLKELVTMMNDNSNEVFNDEEYCKFMYGGLAMIRMIDWTLDDSELGFEEYCLKTNEDISKEFGLTIS